MHFTSLGSGNRGNANVPVVDVGDGKLSLIVDTRFG